MVLSQDKGNLTANKSHKQEIPGIQTSPAPTSNEYQLQIGHKDRSQHMPSEYEQIH